MQSNCFVSLDVFPLSHFVTKNKWNIFYILSPGQSSEGVEHRHLQSILSTCMMVSRGFSRIALTRRDGCVDQSLDSTFANRLNRLRARDEFEVEQFVARYEPFLRRTLRFRITRASLNPAADSVDLCQSVLIGFLMRLSAGDYEFGSEEEIRKMLLAIANKKFLKLNRREMAAKRCRAQTQSLNDLPEIAASVEKPAAKSMKTTEMLQQLSMRMSSQEMELYRLRSVGRDWTSISEELGESPSNLRKRLSRAIQRVAMELGLEEEEE